MLTTPTTIDQALRKLRLSGMADVLETRLLQAQTEPMAPIDLLAALVTDELQRREDRLLARRHNRPDSATPTARSTLRRLTVNISESPSRSPPRPTATPAPSTRRTAPASTCRRPPPLPRRTQRRPRVVGLCLRSIAEHIAAFATSTALNRILRAEHVTDGTMQGLDTADHEQTPCLPLFRRPRSRGLGPILQARLLRPAHPRSVFVGILLLKCQRRIGVFQSS